MAKRVVVVGAGISGLTCAYRLQRSGLDVIVLESSDVVGGVIQTDNEHGFLCEVGPNSFQGTPEVFDLIREIGLEGELVTADSRLARYIFHRGKLHPAPMGPGALLSTKLLSLRAKLKLFREPWVRPYQGASEESLAGFVCRRFGPEALRNLVAPFVSGVYAGDPRCLSARSAFPMLVEFEEKYGSVLRGFIRSIRKTPKPRRSRSLCSFVKGLHTLPRVLAEKIGAERVLLGARVRGMRPSEGTQIGAYTLRIQRGGENYELGADVVVLATSAYRAAELAQTLSLTLERELAAVEYPPLAGICVAYKKGAVPHPLQGFGFLVPRDEGVRLLGCIWSSSLFPGRAPEGYVLLSIFIGGSVDPEVASLSDHQVIEAVTQDLRTTLGVQIAPRVLTLNRYGHAIPQYGLGHEARLSRIKGELQKLPGVFLAGNYLRGISIGDCIKHSTLMANRLIHHGDTEGTEAHGVGL